ncbi:DUF6082 family protein [Actinoplanes sp. NPDC026619]|uniref:DUF6082 family protein n=1 Tax=Actinoplanes sp. NPDC026619 TaxID=3155798 RepID=UPI0033CA767E
MKIDSLRSRRRADPNSDFFIDRRPGRPIWLIATLIGVLLFASAPLAWLLSTNMPGPALDRLSDVGQAYGVVSGALSALALIAVAASIFVQQRHNRSDSRHAWQSAHMDLLKMVLSDPQTYGPCLGDHLDVLSETEYRQHIFTTMYFNYLRWNGIQDMSAGERTEAFGAMFRVESNRKLWLIRRRKLLREYGALGTFHSMVDQEYQRAVANPMGAREFYLGEMAAETEGSLVNDEAGPNDRSLR